MNKPKAQPTCPNCTCGQFTPSAPTDVNTVMFGLFAGLGANTPDNQRDVHPNNKLVVPSFESALAAQQAMYRPDKPDHVLLAISARELGLITDGLSEAILAIYRRLHELTGRPVQEAAYHYQFHYNLSSMSSTELTQFQLDPALRYLLSNDSDVKRLEQYLAIFKSCWADAYADLPVIQLLNAVGPWRLVELSVGLFVELIQQQSKPYNPLNSLTFRKANEVLAACTSTAYAQFVRDAIAAGGLSKPSCRVAMNRLASLHLAEMKAQ